MATSQTRPPGVWRRRIDCLKSGELVAASLDGGPLALYRIERVLRRAPSGQPGVVRTRYAARRASVELDGKLKFSQYRYGLDSRFIRAVGDEARLAVVKLRAEESEAEAELLGKLLDSVKFSKP